MNLILYVLFTFGMYFSSFSGSINEVHKKPFLPDAFKYSMVGGYTAFGFPYARFSMRHEEYTFHLFMLASGKMAKTDAEGNILGDVFYNGIIVSAGKTIYKDSVNAVYIEPGIYLETADGWYNPGLGVNVKYRRIVYDGLVGEVSLRNIGFSTNPKEPFDFDAIFSVTYLKYGIDPFFSIDVSPERKLHYYAGITLPLHNVFSASLSYTDAYREFKFGSGSDILNGLSLGMNVKTSLVKVMYIADFLGEGGVSHSVELRFLK